MTSKKCKGCNIEKELDLFRKDKRSKYGVESRCKRCRNDEKNAKYNSDSEFRKARRAANKAWRETNKEYIQKKALEWREANREHYLEYHKKNNLHRKDSNKLLHRGLRIAKYWPGSTWEDALVRYELLLKSQNYCCAICKKHQSHFKKSLAIDHDHSTGDVRKLLCYRCNRLYVSIHTVDTAKAVYEYLLEFVSKQKKSS